MTTQATVGGPKPLAISETLRDIEGRSVPPSPLGIAPNALSQSEIKSLTDAWTEAKKRFAENTKILLGDKPIDIEKALVRWQAQAEDDVSEKAKQRVNKVLNVYNNIKDGIQVLAELAATGAQAVFGFAGAAINALTFLLEIPERISDVYDTLIDLFEEVESFLARFKILNRLDRKNDLSVDMIVRASNMLVCFVDVCGVAWKALKHQKRTIAKAAFLRNDSGVGNALTEFRQKAFQLDRMINTVTLEVAYDVKRTARELNASLKNIARSTENVWKSMEQTNTEATKSSVYAKRHDNIKERIYNKDELAILEKSSEADDLLPETLSCLEAYDIFRRWRDGDHDSNRAELALQGPSKSGKSSLMKALKKDLEEARDNPEKIGSIYVAYHDFSKGNSKSSSLRIPFALRNMAMQVAKQSTAYASELEAILKNGKTNYVPHIDDVEDLWNKLKLSTFEKKAQQAKMYLLFDGIEIESQKSFMELIEALRGKTEVGKGVHTLSIRAAFTIDPGKQFVSSLIPVIHTEKATANLVQQYTNRELKKKRLFPYGGLRSSQYRHKILDAFKNKTFGHAEHKLEHINYAYHQNLDAKYLDEILQDETGQLFNKKGTLSLIDLAGKLNPCDIAELNLMLPWLLYSSYSSALELEELEAVSYFANDSESLQSLREKILVVYREVLSLDSDGFVCLEPGKELILREAARHTASHQVVAKGYINMDLAIRNVEEPVLRRFIWELNEHVKSGKFEFGSSSKPVEDKLDVNETKSHVDMTKLCLKLLNEGWHERTQILVRYALQCLPDHFIYLAANTDKVTAADQQTISYGLVNFLTAPSHLSRDGGRHFGAGVAWLSDTLAVNSVRSWLDTTKSQLRPRDQKWIEGSLAKSRLGHMNMFARAVGKKWLRHHNENASDRLFEPGVRTSNALEVWLFRWLDLFIQYDTQEVSDHQASTGNNEETQQTADQSNTDTAAADSTSAPDGTQDGGYSIANSESKTITEEEATLPVLDEVATKIRDGDQILVKEGSTKLPQEGSITPDQNGITTIVQSEEPAPIQNVQATSAQHEEATSLQDADMMPTQNENSAPVADEETQTAPLDTAESDQHQSNLTPTSTIKEVTVSDRIEKVIEWVKDQEVAYLDKGIANINIGYTFLYHGYYDKAEAYFNRAMQEPKNARRSLIALGRLHYARGDKVSATEKFREGLDIFEKQESSDTHVPEDAKALAGLYCELATIYNEAAEPDLKLMIDLYEKSLRYNNDLDVRWKLLKLLCQDDETTSNTRAFDAFTQWANDCGEGGKNVAADAIRKTAKADPDCDELESFVHSIQDPRLRDSVFEIISAAMPDKDAGDAEEVQRRGELLYLQGLLIAKGSKENRWLAAVEFWQRAFALADFSDDEPWNYNHFSHETAVVLAQHYLDQSVAILRDMDKTALTDESKDAQFQELVMVLKTEILKRSVTPPFFVMDIRKQCLISFNVALERHDEARKLSAEDVSIAINILSDDDTDNDTQGVEKLMRNLCWVGDTVGTLIAFSLNDRGQEEEEQQQQQQQEGEKTQAPRVKAGAHRLCDACRKDIYSKDKGGYWLCSFCYGYDVCPDCHDKWMQDKLNLYRCHKDLHQRIRVYHVDDYDEEEKKGNMVRIDWEWEDCGNGKFKRNGGRLVHLSEWLSLLKTQWKIAEDAGVSLAQK